MDDDHTRVLALGPVRHACHACGSCCTGWGVRIANDDERERVTAYAQELGVDEPIVDGKLRQVDATCVFLGADKLCRIHGRFGAEQKPLVCKLFPRRALRAEDGIRIGADPGCSSTWRTYADGPELDLSAIPKPQLEAISADLVGAERALVALAGTAGMTVPRFAAVLSREIEPEPRVFPTYFGLRLMTAVRGVASTLADPENGPLLSRDLAKVVRYLHAFDPDGAGPLRIPVELDGMALEMMRRMLFLRLGDDSLPPIAQCLIVLGGIVACAQVEKRLSTFGPALSAWSRVSRVPAFWVPFIPDTDSARRVIEGG